jgi:hypothetical protein
MKTKYFGGALIPLLVPVSAVAQADPASETVAEIIVTGTRSGDAVPIDKIGGSVRGVG